ncbi:hypothetical protein [Paenibacillus sp. NPDC057934]|uniref:hypothetical protein n=1 Tax=Paenibacillus sp. NPDC057934 TaxID=3346282 RepID=UPI0036DE4DA6
MITDDDASLYNSFFRVFSIVDSSISRVAYLKLKKQLKKHTFHKEVIEDGKSYRKWGNNKIAHPLPSIDKGWYDLWLLPEVIRKVISIQTLTLNMLLPFFVLFITFAYHIVLLTMSKN